MRGGSRRHPRAGTAALVLALAASSSSSAHADPRPRVLVHVEEGDAALAVRLGAELGALGFEAVPVDADAAADGAALVDAARAADARGALVLHSMPDGVEACVLERSTSSTTCRFVASAADHPDAATTATRAAELLRATLLDAPGPPAPPASPPPRVTPSPRSSDERDASPSPASPSASARRLFSTRLGPALLVTPGGVPPSVAATFGAEWVSLEPIAFGVHAVIPFDAPVVARSVGTAAVRTTWLDAGASFVAHRGALRAGAGLGGGAAAIAVDGSGAPPYAPSSGSAWIPFVATTLLASVTLERAVSLRADLVGAYTTGKASIRFAGVEEASVRPMVLASLSLEIAWP